MSTRPRIVGRVLLAAVEAGLALVVLGSVAMLLELRAASAGGASGEGTFAVGFLFLWTVAGLGLGLLLGAHVLAAAAWTADRSAPGGLPARFRRHAVELAGSAVVAVALIPEAFGGNPFVAALAASASVALATVVHVTVETALQVRHLAAG